MALQQEFPGPWDSILRQHTCIKIPPVVKRRVEKITYSQAKKPGGIKV
jgi:hypothetical protein